MAVTPKPVRRNRGNCTCPDGWRQQEEYDRGTCKYGYCFSARCRQCKGEIWGAGPLACPCEHPRWCRYPGMRAPGHWDRAEMEYVRTHAAIKPSIAKRRSKRRVKEVK